MRRLVFTILSVLSLLLCVWVAILWVRSWPWVGGQVDGALVLCYAGGSDGRRLITMPDGSYWTPEQVFLRFHHGPPSWYPAFGRGAFHLFLPADSFNFDYWWLSLPDWLLILLFAVLPVVWIFKTRQRKRAARENLCLHCGYSLRGNISGVCPECGERIAEAKVARPV